MREFDRETFIKSKITGRLQSLIYEDLQKNRIELKERIEGKHFLVIGGAGTIGSSFIKAILPFRPSAITVVDYNENGLAELVRDLRSTYDLWLPVNFITYPFDFGSPLLEKLFDRNTFDIVACFAAHKHVRSEKDVLAIEAMITNNVFNTSRLLHLCTVYQLKHVFAVSTDKASNPVNIMGGSKKLMEKVILAYSKTLRITTARFANVAFSNGSLLDGFIQRMAKHQPLSAPNDVKRYFVTPGESGEICMLAALLGETGDIFFPFLPKSGMKTFSGIAEDYLEQIGYQPDICKTEDEARKKAARRNANDLSYPVYYFQSDTTGEKPFEEFYTDQERLDQTSFDALGIVKSSAINSLEEINGMLDAFRSLFAKKNFEKEDIVLLMKAFIPEFQHMETGKYLDAKM